tara:strand:+ start:427 stop:660 length:234 start_codon:yes stop_codon:yes gene_type:complete
MGAFHVVLNSYVIVPVLQMSVPGQEQRRHHGRRVDSHFLQSSCQTFEVLALCPFADYIVYKFEAILSSLERSELFPS